MQYEQLAEDILRLVGGKENIRSAAHCATRLRLVLADDTKLQKAEIEKLSGVKGSFMNAGQYQIILGQGHVNKVFACMMGEGMHEASSEELKRDAAGKLGWFQRFARTLSNIFVPIIPVIVASGVLMGVLGMLSAFHAVDTESGVYQLLDMFSNAAFTFLPILIAFSAAKEFGCNPYLAAALGGIMVHPSLQNAWNMGKAGQVTEYMDLFGLQVAKIGYQGTVLPILLVVLVMAFLEKRIRKIIPNVLDILLTPFFTLLITGIITFFVIGPIGRALGNGISFVLTFLYEKLGVLAGILFGGAYSSIVITGMHHSFHAVETQLIGDVGVNFLLPIWSMANVAQGGAALAVYFKTRDKKLKSVAAPASLSCLLGITEAAIFGVNLPLMRPFIAPAIGGALGGGFVVFMKVGMQGIGVTGIPGIAIVEQNGILMYCIGMAIAFVVAFTAAWLLGFKETKA